MEHSKIVEEIVNRNDNYVKKHNEHYFIHHIASQHPIITLVSCSDSRVQPNVLIENPINNMFEIENIGNQISTCEGSVSYGVLYLKTPVILILGHSDCGALKAFMNGYEKIEASIKKEIDNLRPVGLSKEYTAENFEEILLLNAQKNIDYQVNFAVKTFKDLIRNGKLTVIGAYYDFKNEFDKGYGRMLILNVNGEKNRNKIKGLPVFEHLSKEFKDVIIDRYSTKIK
ncbi:Carbonic anhydrase [groundwater metagenome]|uniref:carbonic anhydrase n=1 Tax=groundwater metagenome TaxID=717931 RepID=A0A098E890_9ZZZZ